MGQGEETRGAACRGGGSGAERLIVMLGGGGSFGLGFGRSGNGDTVCSGAGVGFYFDAHQILIRDFPAEVPVLSALLEILFQKDGAAGIGDKSAGGGQKDIAGAILHLHATPEKGGVASHLAPSVSGA